MKTNLQSFQNKEYHPGSALKIGLWYLVNALFFTNYVFPFSAIKVILLRAFGAKIGRGVVIKPNVNIKYPWLLEIGSHVWIGEQVWIDNLANVTIGDHVCISQGALLLCGNHNYKKPSFDLVVGKITIEDGSWIGAKAVVCPDVIVHSHAILSVGSVATKNLESYGIYQGNPATKSRDRKIETN